MRKEWYLLKSYYYNDDTVKFGAAGKMDWPIKPTRRCYREGDCTVFEDWFDSLESLRRCVESWDDSRD